MKASNFEGKSMTFRFATHPPISGVVEHSPSATGDCWIILTDDGDRALIQQFDFAEERHVKGIDP